MSDHSAPESADSTSDLNAPVTESCGNAKPTSGDAESSPLTGPKSPAIAMSALSLSENQRGELLLTDYAHQLTTGGGKPGQGFPAVLISSAAGSPAKISLSPDAEPASKLENDPACSSSAQGSLTLFSPLGDGSCLRTFPDSFPARAAEISLSFSRRWPTSGFTTAPGECWTADSSESPNAGGVSTSLRDVLQDDVPPRYFLSPKAAQGILRRAEKRGRALPTSLSAALSAVAEGLPETTSTEAEPS